MKGTWPKSLPGPACNVPDLYLSTVSNTTTHKGNMRQLSLLVASSKGLIPENPSVVSRWRINLPNQKTLEFDASDRSQPAYNS